MRKSWDISGSKHYKLRHGLFPHDDREFVQRIVVQQGDARRKSLFAEIKEKQGIGVEEIRATPRGVGIRREQVERKRVTSDPVQRGEGLDDIVFPGDFVVSEGDVENAAGE